MTSSDRWCVKVHGYRDHCDASMVGVITDRLYFLGYDIDNSCLSRNGTFWLCFDGESVKACRDVLTMGDHMHTFPVRLTQAYTELHPVDIFNGMLKPYEKPVKRRCETCKYRCASISNNPCCVCRARSQGREGKPYTQWEPYVKPVEKEKEMDKVYIEVPELARDAVRAKLRELFGDVPPIDCHDACLVFVGMPELEANHPWWHNPTDCYGSKGYRKLTLDEFFKMKPEPVDKELSHDFCKTTNCINCDKEEKLAGLHRQVITKYGIVSVCDICAFVHGINSGVFVELAKMKSIYRDI